MSTITRTGVRCGNHHQPTYHASVIEARDCFRNSGKGSQRVENLDEKLDAAFGEPTISQLDRRREQELSPARQPVTKDGIYRNPRTGDIFKVYHTVHGANQLVAKRLNLLPETQWYTKTVRGKEVTVKAEFVYEGKAGLRDLTADMQMTLEEGKKYGAIYGVCVRCCATLTAEVSIECAMGPICAGKANWA